MFIKGYCILNVLTSDQEGNDKQNKLTCSSLKICWTKNCWRFSFAKLMQSCSKLQESNAKVVFHANFHKIQESSVNLKIQTNGARRGKAVYSYDVYFYRMMKASTLDKISWPHKLPGELEYTKQRVLQKSNQRSELGKLYKTLKIHMGNIKRSEHKTDVYIFAQMNRSLKFQIFKEA